MYVGDLMILTITCGGKKDMKSKFQLNNSNKKLRTTFVTFISNRALIIYVSVNHGLV